MPLAIAAKLRIRENMNLLTINAPADFISHLQPLPARVHVSSKTKTYQQIHWFVKNKSEMEKGLNKVLKLLKDDLICWIYYPKGSSKLQTDLTRDKGWESLLKHKELQWISLISFDAVWSSFGMRLQKEDGKKKTSKTGERPILDYIDAATKTVRLPEEFAHALRKSKKAMAFFENISFTNRKEYVEWIVTARREETRNERIKASVERLERGWRNPRNL